MMLTLHNYKPSLRERTVIVVCRKDSRIRVYGSGSRITLLSSVILQAAVLQIYNHVVLWMLAWTLCL
jgi:hypothetical protein